MTAADGSAGDRIVTLDIIRGVAVMGIFSVNVVHFAMIEAAYFNPSAYGGATGASLAVWAANMLVIDGKMRSLFSMLFGASALLVIERAEAGGESGWSVHARRMAALLLFGALHHFLLWSGDILLLYAATGFLIYLARWLPVRMLVLLGAALMALHMLLFTGFLLQATQAQAAALAPDASAEAIKNWTDGLGQLAPSAAEIARDMDLHHGSWWTITADKLADADSIVVTTLLFLPQTAALMLLGMAGFRNGFLAGEWSDSAYRKAALVGIGLGGLFFAGLIATDIRSGFDIFTLFGGFVVASAPILPVMAFGYAGLIILLTRNHGWLARRVAAAGRAAFTNYLATSLIAAFVFYGWGLALYGSVTRWQAWLLVPCVWLLMLAWSKPWLDRFRYGPLEWAWRSLARWEVQPMRRRRLAAST